MIHLRFDFNQIKNLKKPDFLNFIECIMLCIIRKYYFIYHIFLNARKKVKEAIRQHNILNKVYKSSKS